MYTKTTIPTTEEVKYYHSPLFFQHVLVNVLVNVLLCSTMYYDDKLAFCLPLFKGAVEIQWSKTRDSGCQH